MIWKVKGENQHGSHYVKVLGTLYIDMEMIIIVVISR